MTTRSRRHFFACAVLAAIGLGAAGARVARVIQAPSSAPGFGADSDWAHYLGHPGSTQYSRLDHINKDNVHRLEEVWTYETGDSAEYQTNNLIVEGVLYTATPSRRVTALDAATGEPRWTFDPDSVLAFEASKYEGAGLQRGLMVWAEGDERRIFTSKGPWLYALDAKTGGLVASFGEGGRIHLGDYVDAPGSETWPEGYLEHTGGASDWSGIAIDVARGIVYSSTETAGPDFYGGKRFGENLFANSLVALDARTGQRLWHYQLVHHDLWDMDNPSPPTLLSVTHEGQRVDVVAQGTLNAVDLNTGEIKWRVRPSASTRRSPLGAFRRREPRTMERPSSPPGAFIGATADETFRAFDKDTDEVLWEAELPFSGNATPSTYMVEGRQFVVIAAGGGRSNRLTGGSLVAFALPMQ